MVELNKTTVGDNSENGAHNMVKLTIDNCEVVVPEHTTILDAAKSVGIQIPTLCYLRDLNEIGGCRVCVVEVAGCDQLSAPTPALSSESFSSEYKYISPTRPKEKE